MMDNPLLRINGSKPEQLRMALDVALMQQSYRGFSSWEFDKKKGLILGWSKSEGNAFPYAMSAEEVLPIVLKYLDSDDAKFVPPSEECENLDHDGSNKRGWEVYTEKWGHVGSNHYAICAIRPAWLWLGK